MTATDLTMGEQVMQRGFYLAKGVISAHDIARAREVGSGHGQRGLARHATVQALAHVLVQQLEQCPAITAMLAPGNRQAQLIGALWFDKTEQANWRVPWHQDRHAHVRKWPGATHPWGAWSQRDGLPRVELPEPWSSQRIAARVHLDDCASDNAPLQVIPGSHRGGVRNASGIELAVSQGSPELITARAGDVVWLHPLLIHRSAPAVHPGHRRVLHLEWCALDLPCGAWADWLA